MSFNAVSNKNKNNNHKIKARNTNNHKKRVTQFIISNASFRLVPWLHEFGTTIQNWNHSKCHFIDVLNVCTRRLIQSRQCLVICFYMPFIHKLRNPVRDNSLYNASDVDVASPTNIYTNSKLKTTHWQRTQNRYDNLWRRAFMSYNNNNNNSSNDDAYK